MSSHVGELENAYSGKRIFLLGNGPSLNDTPLRILDDEYTLAMNKINHIYDSTSWRPDFYFVSSPPDNVPGAEKLMNFIEFNMGNPNIKCLLNSTYTNHISEGYDDIYFMDRIKLNTGINPFHLSSLEEIKQMDLNHLLRYWSDDLSHFAYHYHSMYEAVQFAVYAGFEEIYFVGTDLGMEYSNPHMVSSEGLDPYKFEGDKYEFFRTAYDEGKLASSFINGMALKAIQTISGTNISKKFNNGSSIHFDGKYLQDLKIHDYTKDEIELRKGHVATKRICEHKGIDVFNATIGGELEIYPRKNIHDIL